MPLPIGKLKSQDCRLFGPTQAFLPGHVDSRLGFQFPITRLLIYPILSWFAIIRVNPQQSVLSDYCRSGFTALPLLPALLQNERRPVRAKNWVVRRIDVNRDVTEAAEQAIIKSALVKKISAPVDSILNRSFQTTPLRPIKLLLNGSWLGHPLHPLLTDIPVGAWTLAILFDLLGLLCHLPQLGIASSIAVAVGIAGALGAAAAGLMDWMDIDPAEKSVGAVHGIINTGATLFFVGSLLMRWRDGWTLTWASLGVAIIGYLLVSAGAYLGGGMVFHLGVMINRNAYRSGPSDFKTVIAEKDLIDGQPKRVEVDGQPILLLKSASTIYAIGAVCSHYGAPLEEGKLVDGTIQCPWHLSRFSLRDGSVKEGPACAAVPCYDVQTVSGQVQVKMRV
jgi:nitrite reductase/ring-hydroxylating ferredoxin subunit/uncharacterized membrane protein